jgi:hypothetical protein
VRCVGILMSPCTIYFSYAWLQKDFGAKLRSSRGQDSKPSSLYVGNRYPPCKCVFTYHGGYADLWSMDLVDWAERSPPWPQGLGARSGSALYLFNAGGAGFAEGACLAGSSKVCDAMEGAGRWLGQGKHRC